jgi:hypothetical protein
MLERLAERPDPFLYFAIIFPLALAILWLGFWYAARQKGTDHEKDAWAFGVAQAAIFGLIALILGFSFSFAVGRYEVRRAIVVSETDAIRSTYLRAGFLPPAKAERFRLTLVQYTRARLTAYQNVNDARAERRALSDADELQGVLWGMAAGTARRDPGSPFFADLTRSVIDLIDVAEQEEAALNNHVPLAVIAIVVLSTLVGAFLLGMTFGRVESPNVLLGAIFCLLFAATVFTILDLDHPQGGFIAIDIAPLQATLIDMTSSPSARLIRAPVQ